MYNRYLAVDFVVAARVYPPVECQEWGRGTECTPVMYSVRSRYCTAQGSVPYGRARLSLQGGIGRW